MREQNKYRCEICDRLLRDHGVRCGPPVLSVDGTRLEAAISALQAIVRNDSTKHRHHKARPWDGLTPRLAGDGGTIWLTPREIATEALTRLGAYVPRPGDAR